MLFLVIEYSFAFISASFLFGTIQRFVIAKVIYLSLIYQFPLRTLFKVFKLTFFTWSF